MKITSTPEYIAQRDSSVIDEEVVKNVAEVISKNF